MAQTTETPHRKLPPGIEKTLKRLHCTLDVILV